MFLLNYCFKNTIIKYYFSKYTISPLGLCVGLLTVSAAHRCGFWEKPPKKNAILCWILWLNILKCCDPLSSTLTSYLCLLSFSQWSNLISSRLKSTCHSSCAVSLDSDQAVTKQFTLVRIRLSEFFTFALILPRVVYMQLIYIFRIYRCFTSVCRHLSGRH